MIPFSKAAEDEIRSQSQSITLKSDMEAIERSRHNPFMKHGQPDADAYIEFATQFNEFINHRPKPFVAMKGAWMRL